MDIRELEPLPAAHIHKCRELWTPTIKENYSAHQRFGFGCPRDGITTCNTHSQPKTSNSQSWQDSWYRLSFDVLNPFEWHVSLVGTTSNTSPLVSSPLKMAPMASFPGYANKACHWPPLRACAPPTPDMWHLWHTWVTSKDSRIMGPGMRLGQGWVGVGGGVGDFFVWSSTPA